MKTLHLDQLHGTYYRIFLKTEFKITEEKDGHTTRFKFSEGVYVSKFTQSLRTS